MLQAAAPTLQQRYRPWRRRYSGVTDVTARYRISAPLKKASMIKHRGFEPLRRAVLRALVSFSQVKCDYLHSENLCLVVKAVCDSCENS